jgi:hypothetical protein
MSKISVPERLGNWFLDENLGSGFSGQSVVPRSNVFSTETRSYPTNSFVYQAQYGVQQIPTRAK